jgi:hypothetical protein
MHFNIISNLNNQAGLQRDYELLRSLLESYGHSVRGIMFNDINDNARADVNIFLETLAHRCVPYGGQNWIVPNPEWFGIGWQGIVSGFTGILAKTQDAMRLFAAMYHGHGPRLLYSSWESPDLYDPTIPRTPHFLHVAGNSQTKNTPSVIHAWSQGQIPANLTILARWYNDPHIPGVRVINRASDEDFKVLVNSHQFHLCPSMYEGFGHSLNEAMGVGATVISLNAPPMNEFGITPELMVPSVGTRNYNCGVLHTAAPLHILERALWVLRTSEEWRQKTAEAHRAGFLARREHFRRTILELWGRA